MRNRGEGHNIYHCSVDALSESVGLFDLICNRFDVNKVKYFAEANWEGRPMSVAFFRRPWYIEVQSMNRDGPDTPVYVIHCKMQINLSLVTFQRF